MSIWRHCKPCLVAIYARWVQIDAKSSAQCRVEPFAEGAVFAMSVLAVNHSQRPPSLLHIDCQWSGAQRPINAIILACVVMQTLRKNGLDQTISVPFTTVPFSGVFNENHRTFVVIVMLLRPKTSSPIVISRISELHVSLVIRQRRKNRLLTKMLHLKRICSELLRRRLLTTRWAPSRARLVMNLSLKTIG